MWPVIGSVAVSGVRRPRLRPSSARCCAVTASPLSCFFEPWVYDRVYLCAGTAKRACSFLGPSPGSESVGLGQGPQGQGVSGAPQGSGVWEQQSWAQAQPGDSADARDGLILCGDSTRSQGPSARRHWVSLELARCDLEKGFKSPVFQVPGWAPAESLCQQSSGIPT